MVGRLNKTILTIHWNRRSKKLFSVIKNFQFLNFISILIKSSDGLSECVQVFIFKAILNLFDFLGYFFLLMGGIYPKGFECLLISCCSLFLFRILVHPLSFSLGLELKSCARVLIFHMTINF